MLEVKHVHSGTRGTIWRKGRVKVNALIKAWSMFNNNACNSHHRSLEKGASAYKFYLVKIEAYKRRAPPITCMLRRQALAKWRMLKKTIDIVRVSSACMRFLDESPMNLTVPKKIFSPCVKPWLSFDLQ